MDKKILSFNEFREYTGFGKETIRKLITDCRCDFAFKGGKKWYIVKDKFDKYMQYCAENNINLFLGFDKTVA